MTTKTENHSTGIRRYYYLPAVLATIALLTTGCASVSVKPESTKASPPPPKRILVENFTFPPTPETVRVDRQGAKLNEFETQLSTGTRDALVKSLQRFNLPVLALTGTAIPRGPESWVVTGEFTRVNQGSRALRVLIGVGSGGSKMVVQVHVLDTKTHRDICDFETTGGSNSEPGLITDAGPANFATLGEGVYTLVSSGAHGVTEDSHRTAKMIADYLSVQLAKSGAIPTSRKRNPKF